MARPSERGPDFVKLVTDDDTAGTIHIGEAGDSVSLAGSTAAALPLAGADQVAPAAYVTGAFGLDSDVKAEAFYDLVVAMRAALISAGIITGAA